MRRLFTGTDRVARTLAVLLALVAVASVTTAWLIQHHTAQQEAAQTAPIPKSLQSTSQDPATPGYSSLPVSPTPKPKANKHHEKPSAAKHPKVVLAPIVPRHLFVPSIGVNTSVAPKPTGLAHDPFINKTVPSFGVPDDMYTTTWWSSGPKPGASGMAVVLGHTQIGGYGVFNKLAKLHKGQAIGLTSGNTTLRFQVLSVHTGISKKDPTALQTLLSSHPAKARLALLTCSGTFNQGYRESEENTVVFAKLVSVAH